MKDCLFCAIANEDPRKQIIWQNDRAAAFKDVHPKAPTHVLVVTKKHYDDINAIDNVEVVGNHLLDTKQAAHDIGVGDNFRLVINTGPHTGMMDHFHVHILGGKPLDDYPRDPKI